MRLLVTGGAGFIGSSFIKYWMRHHPADTILNFDKLTYAANLDTLKEIDQNPNYSFVQGDITDSEAVDKVMPGTDFVVHFAAETHVDRSILDPFVFIKTNVLGTGVLLQSALKNKIKRFHHISTDEVFGSLPFDKDSFFREETPYDPRSPYSASKAGSDHLVRAYHETFGLPISITNCANNFGPFMFPEKFIPYAVTNVIEGKKIPIYGDGMQVRDWLFVDDHARAIEKVLLEGRDGETYLVGSMHEDIPNIEVARRIVKLLGKDESSFEYVTDRPGHDKRYAIDWSKIKQELGWEPEYDFDTYLEKTVRWYQENEAWWKPLKERVKNR